MNKIKVAILGPGNIGSDLMYKILRSDYLELVLMAGIARSEGIERAEKLGIKTTIEGIDGIIKEKNNIQMVFDATSATAHYNHAPLLKEAGIFALDLTPAAIGPYMVPVVNLDQVQDGDNVNLVTCGGQATVPIVAAISSVAKVEYAEIIASIASLSAGPGTRQNIDEFTETTSKALEIVGKAEKGRAIIILNPADPPVMMSNSIHVVLKDDVDLKIITKAVTDMVARIQQYVPGYQMVVPPIKDDKKITVIIKVKGRGDFLPVYSGNLDIINSAAIFAAEKVAQKMLAEGSDN